MKRGISDDALKRVAAHTPEKTAWDEGLRDPGDAGLDDLTIDEQVDVLDTAASRLGEIMQMLEPFSDWLADDYPHVEEGAVAYFEQYIDDLDELRVALAMEAQSLETAAKQMKS